MKTIKWGIVGPGNIARQFANDFQFTTNCELVAVGSRSLTSAQTFATDFNIPKAYGSYQEVYQDPEVDAIYVATPHSFHLKMTSDALKAGKHVLCEKPLTVNPTECKELIGIAEQSGKYLMEGMWTYFLPAIKQAQQWIAAGRIGKIRHIKADFGYPKPFDPDSRMYNPKLAGGALLDMGIYPIALTWLMLQKDFDSLTVKAFKAATGVDNDVTMHMDFGDEIASLQTSFIMKLHNHAYLIGEKGYIEIPDFWRAKEARLYEGENIVDTFLDDRKGFGFNFEADAVSQDILDGKTQSDTVPWSTSKRLQDIMANIMCKF
ncbi:MAG: Gfo/Idh/MocA family oxidoreductase [Reichenbachiella sp.]